MRWDKATIVPVVIPDDQQRSFALWFSPKEPSRALERAVDLAAMTLIATPDLETALQLVAERKPDLVMYDLAITEPDFKAQLMVHRTTQTLAVLPFASALETADELLGSIGANASETNIFLTIRAALRRERPVAIKDFRQTNCFTLYGSQFKLCRDTECIMIGKTDLCLLGPFFDLEEAVFDMASLTRLVFGDSAMTTSAFVQHLSRTRRYVKAQIKIDPFRTIRGEGYALANDQS